jgi:phosphohistidine swiveling domain-containing protein
MGEAEPIAAILESIGSEFDVVMGRPERVGAGCARLRERLAWPPTPRDIDCLRQLLPLLRKQSGPIAVPPFDLLEDAAAASKEPWSLLEGMLASRDDSLARRALDLAERLARSGSLAIDPALRFLAERVEAEGSPLAGPESFATIARMLRLRGGAAAHPAEQEPSDPVLALYLGGEGSVRRLAARLLDLDGQPVSSALAERVLGQPAHAALGDYLRYTRASHLDLLHLVPDPGSPPPALASLQRAEATCGQALLRDVIAELGWERLNLGVELQACVGVSLGGSIPLMVSPGEAPLLESCAQARRTGELYLFVAHGGLPSERGETTGADPVSRFRAYNLAHAEVLADILEVAPLSRERVGRILGRMDRIVEDFGLLFAAFAEECTILPGLYRELRGAIVSELEKQTSPAQLSAELTRLVQSFEDPRMIGEVRTLHGLKRYLHQRGLRLGFRLVEAGAATNRTVTLVLASRKRVLQTLPKIRYVDFEPEVALRAPYGVALIAEGFARQLLHGQESFPSVQIFCYGNEVHYYLSFRNHPAFVRIDFAPPLLGGMIDLAYYGVSVYELSAHPNPSLEALVLFLRRQDFDVQIEGTHVHARYDKERALDLGDLCEKARLFACLVPYLMDLDWIIGSLSLDAERRRVVADAWSESFLAWGALPLQQLLTRSRQGILVGVESGPSGEREVCWSGEEPYRDRFRVPPPSGFRTRLQASLAELGLEPAPPLEQDARYLIGQIDLERHVLRPLREAVSCGQVLATVDGLRASPPELFERRHEAEVFGEILASGDAASAAHVARLVGPLERTLRFRATGRVNGHELQRALLPLRGESLGLYVLRDAAGLVRLALFSRGDVLCRRRMCPGDAWEASWSADPAELAALLRRNSYLPPGAEPPAQGRQEDFSAILEMFRRPNPSRGPSPLPGERVLHGFRASPGRSVGTALFGTQGRNPEDFDGAVLVAPSVRPEDNTFLYHSRGIVSTGGGILSHAGLIASQFRKPALVVSGSWLREADGSLTLLYRTPEYREELREAHGCKLSLYRDWREPEHRLREGDLVVLDAGEGTLRALGQEHDVLALHEEFRLLGEASRRLARVADMRETLTLRGHRLRAVHQIRKLLGRISDPVLARHAAHELLAGEVLSADAVGRAERAQLLSLLIANRAVGEAARDYLVELGQELALRHQALSDEARRRIPSSSSPAEVLARRLATLRLGQALESAAASLRECGVEPPAWAGSSASDVDRIALRRLEELRADRARSLRDLVAAPALDPRVRHVLRQLERLDLVLGCPHDERLGRVRTRLAEQDEAVRGRHRHRRVVMAEEAGFELHSLVGWKAANLAEVERLGCGGLVPPWFVVTDRAFQEILDSPLDRSAPGADAVPGVASTLREAVDAALARGDLDNLQKSARIRGLWEGMTLPAELSDDVLAAYCRLARTPGGTARPDEDPAEPFVAVRSSAREEDAESAARAGEFETYLFVRGERRLLEFLKRAWSGLWTERAIHNRGLLGGDREATGGGVIVQRVVWSRVSGVLQTVNVAEENLQEMVVNAGLGLGEGVVSGSVEADHIVVAKEGDLERGPLRFRYVTAEKREQVVFDRRAGFGTVRADCLYYQSLRPALEYVELSELVRVAARLEAAYGYPLDVEFGIEGARLFILQVRPVATFLSELRETLERHPLAADAQIGALTG